VECLNLALFFSPAFANFFSSTAMPAVTDNLMKMILRMRSLALALCCLFLGCFGAGTGTKSSGLIDDAGQVTIDALASRTVEGEWVDSKPPTEPLPAGAQVLLLAWRKSAFSTDGVYQAWRTTLKETAKEHPWNLQATLTVRE